MTTICWTIIHYTAAPVAHAGSHVAQAMRHRLGPIVHHAARAMHHVATVAVHPNPWAELVCKTFPAALVGGGLLVPIPATAPLLPAPPPAVVEPIVVPWSPPTWEVPPTSVVPGTRSVPEPSSEVSLLSGVGGLALIRLARRRSRRAVNTSPGSGQPGSGETDLPGGGPILRPLAGMHQYPPAAGKNQ